MSKKLDCPAKISRPGTSGTFLRMRLLSLLDRTKNTPILWVSSPAGSGKTTLIADWLDSRKTDCVWYRADAGDEDPASFFHYMGLAGKAAAPRKKTSLPALTPEYLFALPVFTRRFFEAFFQRIKPVSVVVIDDFQAAAGSPSFVEIAGGMMDALPAGIRLVVLSREELPADYLRLKMNGSIHCISWEEMRFTLEETQGLIRHRHGDEADAEKLHEAAGGWAAGLVLMDRVGAPENNHDMEGSRDELFDYFMTEVMGRADADLRDFLLKTAIFPEFSEAMAEELTESGNAKSLIGSLVKKNFFIERYPGSPIKYRYHQMFREFLSAQREHSFAPEERMNLFAAAAEILSRDGALSTAFRFYIKADQPFRALELILADAPSLLGQGRNKTLIELFDLLPGGLPDNHPWALFWKGAALHPFDPPKARQLFADAFSIFEKKGNYTGMLRCWYNLVETVFHEWDNVARLDPWIAWLKEASKREPAIPDPLLNLQVSSTMTAALTMRGDDPKEMRKWAERTIEALNSVNDLWPRLGALVYCINYISWVQPLDLDRGAIEKSLHNVQDADLPPILRLTAIYTRAAMQFQRIPRMDLIIEDVYRALALAEETGVHVWDEIFYGLGVFCAIVLEDSNASAEFLLKMKARTSLERRQGLAFYHYVCAWNSLVFGSREKAEEEITKALHLYARTGYDFPSNVATYGAAVIFVENGDFDKALAFAIEADAVAVRYGAVSMRYTTLLILAYVYAKRGEKTDAVRTLGEALKIGKTEKLFQTTWWWYAPMMSFLMDLALDEEMEIDYAVSLINELHILPHSTRGIRENWPWPVRIHTLGGFRMEIDGKSPELSPKGQKKLMNLLKAIISLGGMNVSKVRLADILWPEASGDIALNSLETSLYRLRKLISHADAIEVHEGIISLNRHICWVDALAFLEETAEGEQTSVKKALVLYRGHFLPEMPDEEWVIPMREKLRDRFLRFSAMEGRAEEKSENWEAALAFYQRAIEMEPLGEEMVRGAMRAFAALGRKSEAISLYKRFARDLQRIIGIDPSEETKTLMELYLNSEI